MHSTDEKNNDPVRLHAPAALGRHDTTRRVQCTRRDSALTSHVARIVAIDHFPRSAVWGRGAVLFCAALNKRPSLCGVSWWSAGFLRKAARSADLAW